METLSADRYLASGNINESNNFFVNIAFELLNGCQFNCKGCFVNKENAEPFTDEMYEQLVSVLESFTQEKHYRPFIAFLAPTDFLSASNTASVLSNPKIIKVLNYFKRLSFQTTYLNIITAPQVAKVLKEHYSNMELEINIIIEPDQIVNKKYLSIIERNQDTLHDLLGWPSKVQKFGIMNVYDYNTTKISELLKDYDLLYEKVEHLIETGIDFNFSLGRKDELLTHKEFYDSAMQIKKMFDDSYDKTAQTEYLKETAGRLTDSVVERQYNWKGGEFYYSPLLYERYASFIPELKIPIKNYTAKEFEQYEEKVQLSQYSNVDNKDECGECPLLGSCVSRGILHLMDIHNIKECLVSKKAMNVVNAMGTLPISHD